MKLSLAFADPNIASFFSILRSTGGKFAAGGWTDTKTTLKGRGNVSLASPKDVKALPEGDQITGMISVWSRQELFVTHANDTPGTSDIIVWRKEQYRVVSVIPYPERGYWKAICARMSGN